MAAVEVPPGPLVRVIMQPAEVPALRAGPPLTSLVREADVDPLLLDVEVDLLDGPRRRDAQEVAVELRVLHVQKDARSRALAASSGSEPLETRKRPAMALKTQARRATTATSQTPTPASATARSPAAATASSTKGPRSATTATKTTTTPASASASRRSAATASSTRALRSATTATAIPTTAAASASVTASSS